MTRRSAIALLVCIVVVGGATAVYTRQFLSERRAVREQITDHKKAIANFKRFSDRHPEVRSALRKIGKTALADNPEELDARLRTAVSQILGHAGLREPSVGVRRPDAVMNPAFGSRSSEFKGAAARDRVGFVAATANATGRGTLAQVTTALETIRAQGWVHRIDSVTIQPTDRERSVYKLDLALTTLYLPGFVVEPTDPAWSPARPERLEAALAMAQANVFKAPVPPSAPPPVRPPERVVSKPAPAPKPRPETLWRVSGVVEGTTGPELWLRHVNSAKTRVVGSGAAVFGIEFVEGIGERATVRVGTELFEVRLGQTLAQREPLRR